MLEGRGVLIYLEQEGRGIGFAQKVRAYELQDEGLDTVDANLRLGHEPDERDYGAAAEVLASLGVRSIRLLTNNPDKVTQLRAFGVDVTGVEPLPPRVTPENQRYLRTKAERMAHAIHDLA